MRNKFSSQTIEMKKSVEKLWGKMCDLFSGLNICQLSCGIDNEKSISLFKTGLDIALSGDFKKARKSFVKAFSLNIYNEFISLSINIIDDVCGAKITEDIGKKILKAVRLGLDKADGGLIELTEAIKSKDLEYPIVYGYRANLYYQKKDYDSAIEDLTKALKLDAKAPQAYALRGVIYYEKKKFDLAIADLTKALEMNMHDDQVLIYRASCYLNIKDYKNAIKDYNDAIKLEPNNDGYYLGRAYVYGVQGLYDQRIADCKKALKLNPRNEVAHDYIGDSYREQKKYDDAILEYTKAIEINPKSDHTITLSI